MSILIKGKEMPIEDEDIIVRISSDGTVMTEYASPIPWAKAVPVPPHGNLIERKAICLTDFEIAMCDGDYKEGMKMLLEKIENAPTVIPAEEGE